MNKKNIIIKLENISKIYKTLNLLNRNKILALDNISLEIYENEIFTILGPNGAGKTTLLNIIIGLIKPDHGKLYILNEQIKNEINKKIKNKMNMCSGNPNFPWCMKVKEILEFYCYLYGISKKETKSQVEKYIEIFDLKKYAYTRFDELSTGTKQKLSLAKSLLNEPQILLLDEPTLGLDPEIAIKIRDYIKKIYKQKNITILLTTHYMKEAEELSDRIAFINLGKIIMIGNKEYIYEKTNCSNLESAFIKLMNN